MVWCRKGLALQAFNQSAPGLHEPQHQSNCQASSPLNKSPLQQGISMCLKPSLDATLDRASSTSASCMLARLEPCCKRQSHQMSSHIRSCRDLPCPALSNQKQMCAPPSCVHARHGRAECSVSSTRRRRRTPARARCGVAACVHVQGRSGGHGHPGRPQMLPPPPHSTLQHEVVTLAVGSTHQSTSHGSQVTGDNLSGCIHVPAVPLARNHTNLLAIAET